MMVARLRTLEGILIERVLSPQPIFYKGFVIQPVGNFFFIQNRVDTCRSCDTRPYHSVGDAIDSIDLCL